MNEYIVDYKDFSTTKQLLLDYLDCLGLNSIYLDIDCELDNIQEYYTVPKGIFVLMYKNKNLIGGAGLKSINRNMCELKHLFIYRQYRAQGAGLALCKEIMDRAKFLGFEYIRLETLRRLTASVNIYKKLGFIEIEPYDESPFADILYMGCSLATGIWHYK